jgi:hypothetical protein
VSQTLYLELLSAGMVTVAKIRAIIAVPLIANLPGNFGANLQTALPSALFLPLKGLA